MSNTLLIAGQTTALTLSYLGQQAGTSTNDWRIQDSAGGDIVPKTAIGPVHPVATSANGYTFDYTASATNVSVSAELAVPAGASFSGAVITFYGLNGDTYTSTFDIGPPAVLAMPTLSAQGETADGVPSILLTVN